MKIPKPIKELPWPEPFYGDQRISFRVTLAWPVVEHERLLVVTFSRNRERRFGKSGDDLRLVCSKKQKAASVLYKGERSGKRHDLYRAMSSFDTSPSYCYPDISERDEAALAKWLGKTSTQNHFMPELAEWVTAAQASEVQRERDARGELRDEDVDLCPQELPEGLVEYIRREVLPTDHVLVYKKGNVRGLCYRCGQEVRASGGQRFRHQGVTTCPNCGRSVVAYLNTGDSFKLDYVEDVAAIQRGRDGQTVFIRQWHLCRNAAADWSDIPAQLEEVARYAIRGSRVAKWQLEGKTCWHMKAYRYRMDRWTRVKDTTRIYDGQYFFYLSQDWREQLAGTSLRYCDLSGYVSGRDCNPIRFLMDWAKYPAMEKLWKAGYRGLVREKVWGTWKRNRYAIRWTKNSIREAFRFPVRLLKTCPPEKWYMDRVQKMADAWKLCAEGVIREPEIGTLLDMPCAIENIRTALTYASVHKVDRYVRAGIEAEREERLKKEAESKAKGGHHLDFGPVKMPQTYRDYLRECVALGLDLTDQVVLFPKDLERAHDRTTALVKHKANEQERADFLARMERARGLEWEHDGLCIRLPRDAEELIAEGAALNHCVGGYVRAMAKGETMILFIRRSAEPDKPFYTLEWRGGRVIQCRTAHNKSYENDAQVAAFVQTWTARALRKTNVKHKAASAA